MTCIAAPDARDSRRAPHRGLATARRLHSALVMKHLFVFAFVVASSTAWAGEPVQLVIPSGKPRVTLSGVKGTMTVNIRKKWGGYDSGLATATPVAWIDLPAGAHPYDVTLTGADRLIIQVDQKVIIKTSQSATGPVTASLDDLPKGRAEIFIGSFRYDEYDATITFEDRTKKPGDSDLDRMALDLILGDLHKADFSSTPPKLVQGADVPELHAMARRGSEAMNRWFTEVDKYTGAEQALGSPMNRKVCVTQMHRFGGESLNAAEKDCGALSGVRFPSQWRDLPDSIATRLLYFDALVRTLPDEQVRAKAKQRFAARMGWQPLTFRPAEFDTSFVLRPVPMNEWPPAVIKVALVYADGDKQTIDALRSALKVAQPWGCAWGGGGLVREPKGGGFGPARYDADLTVRPDIAGSGGMIECAETKKVKSDGASLAVVKKTDKNAVAVELIAGQGWQKNTDDFGRVTSMTRVVRIYSRVKRTDITPGKLPQ